MKKNCTTGEMREILAGSPQPDAHDKKLIGEEGTWYWIHLLIRFKIIRHRNPAAVRLDAAHRIWVIDLDVLDDPSHLVWEMVRAKYHNRATEGETDDA